MGLRCLKSIQITKFAFEAGAILSEERERWVLWLPVFLGIGIAIYFALPTEPPLRAGIGALVAFGLTAAFGYRQPIVIVLAGILAVVALGFTAAQIRTIRIASPTLQVKTGPVTVIGNVDRLTLIDGGGVKVVISQPEIRGLSPEETPVKIRVSVRSKGDILQPGDRVSLRAVLMPTPEPVAPGAFDFARQAWFEQIGAVGYGVSGMRRIEPIADRRSLLDRITIQITQARTTLAERFRAGVTGPAGPVAAALMTGDRGGISSQIIQDLRDSGLAHLLAISGLHVGLLAGILFFAVRGSLALWERVALHFPIKKWAAVAALAGAFGYLLLTGASVSTQRAFIMTAIVLLAVMVDRAAISMRLVAWAAAIVLLLAPESLWHAGFQMSFAAVIALIATYEGMRDRFRRIERRTWARRVALYIAGVLLTSLVAGLATAPYAGFHFNRFIVFGLAANMVAVPVMGLWIMPWGIAAYALMPFGLEGLALTPMGWGIEAVMAISHYVASWPGAVTLLPAFPLSSLVMFSLGGLWLCLWTQKWRLLGVIPAMAGVVVAVTHTAPDILVDRDAKMVAVKDANGELRISKRSRSFVAEHWLRRAGQRTAGNWPVDGQNSDGQNSDGWLMCDNLACRYAAGGLDNSEPLVVALVDSAYALSEDCRSADVVVSMTPVRRKCSSARVVIDRFDLWREGAHAVWLDGLNVTVLSANDHRGDRPWVRRRGTKKTRPTKLAARDTGGL